MFSFAFTRYFDLLCASPGGLILEQSLLLPYWFPVRYSFAKRMQLLHIAITVEASFFVDIFYCGLEPLHFQFVKSQERRVG